MDNSSTSGTAADRVNGAFEKNDDEVEGELRKTVERTYLPDDVLNELGSCNPKLLMSIFSTALVWALNALPLMASSFTMGSMGNETLRTLEQEFDLHGERSYLAELTTSAFMAGNFLGGTLLTPMADRFGRRPVLILYTFCISLAGIISAFSVNIWMYLAMRFLQGSFYFSSMIAWTTGYESASMKLRSLATLLFGLAWLIGYSVVAPLAFLATTWRELVLMTSIPTIFYPVWAYMFVPETIHFLVSKGKTEKVEEWLEKVGGKTPLNIKAAQIKNEEKEKGSILQEIWAHKIFILYCIVLPYLWICDTFVYFGISLYSTQLAGDKYINYLLMGFVELPAYLFTPVMLSKLGRRPVVVGTHLVAGASFFAAFIVPAEPVPTLIIWMIGKCCISISFMAIFVHSSEIFPTNIRNGAVGMCAVVGRLGGVIAPQIRNMDHIHHKLPVLVLGVIASVGGFGALVLPETRDKPLPSVINASDRDTIKTETEDMSNEDT